MFSARLILPLLITTVVFGDDYQKNSEPSDFKRSLSKDCAKSYTSTCLKLDIVSWVDKLSEEDDYSVLPGVSLVKETTSARSSSSTNTAEIVAGLARDFPNDPDARLDAYLLKKVTNYLDTHTIRLDLWDNKSVKDGEARGGGGGGYGGGGGGGGGKKGGGGLGYILAAGAMMKGTLFALALGGLAAIAGKALLTALISLLISTIIGLKSLTHHGKSTTYEVISKPIYAHANSHSYSHDDHHGYGHSSYGRSFDGALPAGLRDDYKPAQ